MCYVLALFLGESGTTEDFQRMLKKDKILLLGDFSGLQYNISKQLKKDNFNVTLASSGDGWKKIPCDIKLSYGTKGIKNKILNRILPFYHLPKLIGYKKVQLIHSRIMPNYLLNKILLYFIFKYNKDVFLLACGTDSLYLESCINKKMRYSPYDKITERGHEFLEPRWVKHHKEIVKKVKKVIPILYEYKQAYSNYKNVTSVIPIPFASLDYDFNIQDKIVIFHGIIREDFKGSNYIRKAFELLEKKYPDKAEFIIDGNLPLSEYLKVMKNANIIVDQCRSYGYGVNGVLALSKGKILLSGSELESNREFNIKNSPVINITPNVDDIVMKISRLIEMEHTRLVDMSKESFDYCKSIHSPEKITKMYLKEWFYD